MKIAFYHYFWPHLLKNESKEFRSKISEYLVIHELIKSLESKGIKVIKYSKTPPQDYKKGSGVIIFKNGIFQLFSLVKFFLYPPKCLGIVSKSIFNSKTLVPILRKICRLRNVKFLIFMGHDESRASTEILNGVRSYKYEENNFWENDKSYSDRIKRNELYKPKHKNEFVCVPSSIIKQNCIKEGWNEKQIIVLPHGVDSNTFRPKNLRNKETYPDKILFAGNGATRKGLPYLLKAFEQLQGSYNVQLTILSHGIKNMEVRNVKIKKDVSNADLLTLYQSHDIFILPSLLDGWGLTATEAMACGLPTIVSDITGVSDIIKDGKNGLLVRPKNPDDIYQALVKVIEDKEFAERLGKEARITAEKFSWDYISGIFIEELKNL